MSRRKRTSKRRWIARFFNGAPVPWIALMEWPDLSRKLQPQRGLIHMDAVILDG